MPIKKMWGGDSNKARLAGSVFYLTILQALNFALPLVTIPYLVRVLGIDNFGTLALYTAIAGYWIVVVEYGFNLSATRELSQSRSDTDAVARIVSEVSWAKVFLSVASLLPIIGLWAVGGIPEADLLLMSCLSSVALAMFPAWAFQGLEQMKWIVTASAPAKVGVAVLILIVVDDPEDYQLVPSLYFVGSAVGVACGYAILRFKFGLTIGIKHSRAAFGRLKSGFYLFLSQVKMTLYSNTNTVLLGLVAGTTEVGYYAAAEKIMRALAMMQVPVTRALFPHFSRLFVDDRSAAVSQIKNTIVIVSSVYLPILILFFVLAPKVSEIFYGADHDAISHALRVMIFCPWIIFMSNMFGTQILIGLGYEKRFFFILLFCGILNLFAVTALSHVWGATGASLSLLLIESSVAVLMFFATKGILFPRRNADV